jgi:hypothetical protein
MVKIYPTSYKKFDTSAASTTLTMLRLLPDHRPRRRVRAAALGVAQFLLVQSIFR